MHKKHSRVMAHAGVVGSQLLLAAGVLSPLVADAATGDGNEERAYWTTHGLCHGRTSTDEDSLEFANGVFNTEATTARKLNCSLPHPGREDDHANLNLENVYVGFDNYTGTGIEFQLYSYAADGSWRDYITYTTPTAVGNDYLKVFDNVYDNVNLSYTSWLQLYVNLGGQDSFYTVSVGWDDDW